MKSVVLPALKGTYQEWNYFEVILKVGYILDFDQNSNKYRIQTADEVEEIYTKKGIGDMLQREFDDTRLASISNYISEQPDAYINNLTIAIFEGNPQWIPMEPRLSSFPLDIETPGLEELEGTLGVIYLSGDETLFVLDGQHRIKALRLAVEQKQSILENEVAATLIVHRSDLLGRKKTRRLFTTINRYAKPVSKGEYILLDEDDLSSIITRSVIEDFHLFKGKKIVALNKTANLVDKTDADKFTTTICIWEIAEMLINAKEVYPDFKLRKDLVRVRPLDSVIELHTSKVFDFYDRFFDIFPNAMQFVLKADGLRNREYPGPFSLRPIGQVAFASLCIINFNIDNDLAEKFRLIPDDISNPFWRYILYNPAGNRLYTSSNTVVNFLKYNFNLPLSNKNLESLLHTYRTNKQDTEASLPPKIGTF